MLHFSHLQAWDGEASPFGQELKRLGVAHRFLSTPVSLRYRTRAGLFLRIYPQLLGKTFVSALRSLAFSRPRPDAIVVSSDIEALIFGALRTLLRRRTRIVFQTLIVTPRASHAANILYMAYWRLVLANVDLGICHARAELATYVRLFPGLAGRLAFVPFGTTVRRRFAEIDPCNDPPMVVTAGRSGRDYTLLARAVEGLPCRLTIICDLPGPVAGIAPSGQITILRDCFDDAYISALAGADIVAVPLAVDDISAGQMVLLQAAALGRAIVITRTATTIDYASDGQDALLVGMGDLAGLRHALACLLNDAALRARLGHCARARFDREHSTQAYARGLVSAISSAL